MEPPRSIGLKGLVRAQAHSQPKLEPKPRPGPWDNQTYFCFGVPSAGKPSWVQTDMCQPGRDQLRR